jgi:hypothetical protein
LMPFRDTLYASHDTRAAQTREAQGSVSHIGRAHIEGRQQYDKFLTFAFPPILSPLRPPAEYR